MGPGHNGETSAGNRFLYEFSQNAPHYLLPASINNQPDINLTNHFHLWRQQKTDQTDQFLPPPGKAISGQSKVGQSAISGLSTELIITTGYGNKISSPWDRPDASWRLYQSQNWVIFQSIFHASTSFLASISLWCLHLAEA